MLQLERLDGNNLPLPKYATPDSAGLDFAACLTRPFKVGWPLKDYILVPHVNLCVREEAPKHTTPVPIDLADKLSLIILPGETILVSLGFKCAFPNDYCLHLHVRSSVGVRGLMLANSTGIIDADYRGELYAALYNRDQETEFEIKHGERIVQALLVKIAKLPINEVSVGDTKRGAGGCGSTGTMAIPQAEEAGPPPQSKPEVK